MDYLEKMEALKTPEAQLSSFSHLSNSPLTLLNIWNAWRPHIQDVFAFHFSQLARTALQLAEESIYTIVGQSTIVEDKKILFGRN